MMSVGKAGTASKNAEFMTQMADPTVAKNDKNETIGATLNKITSGNATGEQSNLKAKNNDDLTKEDFMRLLVAELQSQDPFQPKSNQEFGAQLAQYSQLEQLETMNKNLSKVTNSNEPVLKMYSASLIGKSILTESKDIEHEKGKEHDLSFNLPDGASSVDVKIYDSTDTIVKTLTVGDVDSGLNYVKWDGKGSDGRFLEDGKYKFEVIASDVNGANLRVERGINGKVTSVDYSGEDVSLILDNGNAIKLADIKTVTDAVKAYKEVSNQIPVEVKDQNGHLNNSIKIVGEM